ncbi:filamin-A isoform X3 [Microplitis mediator]|uniref:filamin-A isoform X3 n=1 Tax=Microplitis mediator TaxID=375433 RepID=UPI0025530E3D|nr:filamin-A isoform X3 [Microplitis mediator]
MNENDKSVRSENSNVEEDENEMFERELAEDAQWKRIQQNTFTRWANKHLKSINKYIDDLECDLSDGLNLVNLLEVLSQKRLPKHNKRPNFRSQKLENVAVALKFLDDEGIRIVNIDSSDIVDCKLKLILGLIWTLILHYSISMPMWDYDDTEEAQKGATPKQRLMHWIQAKLPELPINNFTSDWNDGRAVGALVDAVAPGLCPDWPDWNPKDAVQNASEAMSLADDWLNIPQLISPEEMVNPNVDELSMMTYLSQYPNAKLKTGAPLRARTNPNRVRAYGPGIEPKGPIVNAPANFTVETFSAGKGDVEVTVDDAKGHKLPVDIRFNNDRNLTYSVSYTPKSEGPHKVRVLYGGREIPKSPYTVAVEGVPGDPSKVTASGPGLQPDGVVVNRPTYFDIFTKDAGRGVPEVIILDPQSSKTTVPVKLRQTSPDVWRCEYVSPVTGLHSVNVFFAGKLIPKSPMGVNVAPLSDAKKCRAYGRGLLPNGVRVKDIADFVIITKDAGEGIPEARCIGPGGVNLPITINKIDDNNYKCHYLPIKEGRHVVMITYGGKEIPKSPFEVNVGPYKESSIRVFGPGLHGGMVNHPARFTVDTNGETGALGFSIEGPSKAKIDCHDNGDGTADVTYLPTAPGPYAVHILCDNEDIPKSPYIATIQPEADFHPDKVEVHGPGIQPEGVARDKPTHFIVDAKKAGQAPLDVTIQDALGRDVPVKLENKHDGTVQAHYAPTSGSQHIIMVNYGGVATKKSPYRVKVASPLNPAMVAAFGPGLEKGIKSNTPTHFNIDCREAGNGDLDVTMKSPEGHDLPISLTDNEDGTYTVDYVAPQPGTYTVNLNYGGLKVPQCPIKVNVQPHVDVSKIKVEGLEPSLSVNTPTEFTIDTRAIPKTPGDDNKLSCLVTNPSGGKMEKIITPQNDGTYRVSYTPFEEGRHTIDILYDNVPVPGSPFSVNVKRVCDPRKCKAYGPGLEKGFVNKSNRFTVETSDAGNGGLGLAIEGPSEAIMTCTDNYDGSCSVEYVPTEPGEYDVAIKFGEVHIPGSPFKVQVENGIDAKDVTAYGPGLEPEMIREGIPAQFVVDTSKCDPAQLDIKLKTDKGQMQKPDIKHRGDGVYEVTYQPPAAGSNIQVGVLYGDQDIPKSPFSFKVNPTVEPNKVVLSGPGVASACTASFPVDFVVDTSKAGYGDLEVQVLGPDQVPRKVSIQNIGDGKYKATYLPDDCGRYKVNVKYGGKEVPGSPVNVQSVSTGKADKCKIKEGIQQTLAQGEEYCISVDTENAGRGAVTCRIRSTSGSEVVDIDIEDNGDGTVNIYYTVADAGEYTLNIKFGGQPVPNGFYTFTASEEYREQSTHKTTGRRSHNERVIEKHSSSVQESSRFTRRSTANQQHESVKQFNSIRLNSIPLPSGDGTVTSEVKMPSGNVDKPVIEDNHDGTVSIKYDPREEGLHELYVKFNGEHVQGSPFKFHVDSLSSGYVTAYGPGLIYGVCGEPANFTISTKGAGDGGLSLAVEGPSKAEISCHDNKDGTVSVSYLPTAPGEYKISVKFGDKPIKGSPYVAKITGEGRKRNQISVGSSSEVQLPGKVSEADIRSLNGSITAPSGLEEPCFLKKMPSGNICVSFTPREAGEHVVAVKRMGKHIQNSPFKIDVKDREVGDAKKVKVSGSALKEGKTHVENIFSIDTRNAGFGGLSLSMEGPSKAEIQCKDNADGTLNVSYKPTEPGYYIMNLKFADHHVEGSPFTVKVSGEGSNRQREKIQRRREAVPITEVGSQCKLTFKMPGITSFDLSATVTSPGGVTEDAEIKEVEDGLYAVAFVPKELGVHTVSVRYKEMHIPGSPFQFTVGPLKDGGAHRVHAGGPGLERGEQGEPCEFNIWTREAGAGTLAISVEGPSKALIDFKDRKDGSCYVSYCVSEPGDYRVGIKFNDQHIPDSPHKVYISPAVGDAHKLEVAQFPENGVQPDNPATFLVRNNGARGQLDGKIVSPSGVEDDCFIQAIDSEEYSVRFMPRENGIHNIHLKFNGVHINGSPFRVKVGKVDADPAAIQAYGNGLKEIKTGQKTDFIVDTCNAGHGALAVTVDGPSKVAMDCTEVEEGYKVRYTPLVPGDYYISIKYNGYHIAGSPFKVTATGQDLAEKGAQETSSIVVETVQKFSKSKQTGPVLPRFKSDASKVTSKGMGLKKAYLGKQNQFSVSAGEAGSNILYVGVYGPKGPCEEVYVKHVGRNNYNVSYLVRERGEYIVIVKWGDDHIPGSPFKVDV